MLPTNAHKGSHMTFRNGVARSEVETIILMAIEQKEGDMTYVRDFVDMAREVDSKCTCKQLAHVAYQMSERGELQRYMYGGDYAYRRWTAPAITE